MKIATDIFSLKRTKCKFGICLSGGGALGFAHIGVLQALEENGIFPEVISGSSMGAIIGALYAAGYSPEEMLQMIRSQKLYKVTKLMTLRPGFLKSGLSSHSMLRDLIKELVPDNNFEKLKKKFNVCVVNLNSAEWQIINSGQKLDKWIAASASIPGLFESIQIGQEYYVDGGVLNNLPAQSLTNLCQNIIGVDVLPHIIPFKLSKPIDALVHSIRVVQVQNAQEGRDLCDFLIEPTSIQSYHEFSFEAYHDIYLNGYETTKKYISVRPDLMKLSYIG